MEWGQHNVTEIADFVGKPFPCPVCNIGLKIKITAQRKTLFARLGFQVQNYAAAGSVDGPHGGHRSAHQN
jgi:hypothetical protein